MSRNPGYLSTVKLPPVPAEALEAVLAGLLLQAFFDRLNAPLGRQLGNILTL